MNQILPIRVRLGYYQVNRGIGGKMIQIPEIISYLLLSIITIGLLRISYEVIKTVDENAYVCIGGIGNPAFLDAVLRNTDNPIDGTENNDYPLLGGAYFDVLSFHSYPHIDGSM